MWNKVWVIFVMGNWVMLSPAREVWFKWDTYVLGKGIGLGGRQIRRKGLCLRLIFFVVGNWVTLSPAREVWFMSDTYSFHDG